MRYNPCLSCPPRSWAFRKSMVLRVYHPSYCTSSNWLSLFDDWAFMYALHCPSRLSISWLSLRYKTATDTQIDPIPDENEPHEIGGALNERLQRLVQKCPETEEAISETGRRIVLATADSYRLSTMLYLRYSVLRWDSRNTCKLEADTSSQLFRNVDGLRADLLHLLESLPVDGEFYTAIYPLWPLFIYCVTTFDEMERDNARMIISALQYNSSRSVSCPFTTAVFIITCDPERPSCPRSNQNDLE